jgi:hypothetical protein
MDDDLGRLRHSGIHSGAGVYRRQCRRPDCLTFLVTVSSGRSKAITVSSGRSKAITVSTGRSKAITVSSGRSKAITVSSGRSKAEWIPPHLGAAHLGEPSNGNAL